MKKFLLLTALSVACFSGTALGKEILVNPVSTEVVTPESGSLFYVEKSFSRMAALPAYTIAAPSGLVSSYGVLFAGIAGQTNSNNTDGSLAFGAGFGDANESIGGSAGITIGSVDPRDGGGFNRGSLNLNVGHNFQQYGLGLAVGVSSIDLWHASGSDGLENDPSFYGAVTKLLPNEVAPLILTAGLGNNGYTKISATGDLKKKIGGFVSAAAYVMPQVSLIADYTSNMLSIGTGLVPFPKYPVSLTLGIKDLTKQSDDKPFFFGALSAAYVF